MYLLSHLKKSYQATVALNDISFSVKKGEVVGVVGKSGSGKSTLLRQLNLLETPTAGSLEINGRQSKGLSKREIRREKQKIGMVFQQFNLLNNLTVRENVALPLKLSGQKDEAWVDELIEIVAMKEKVDKYPAQLSGGEKQRIAIARAMIRKPDVILCDEATSSLDEKNTDEIIKLLEKMHNEFNITIFFVSHQLDAVKKLCKRVLVMQEGHLLGEVTNQPSGVDLTADTYLEQVKRRMAP
ncbi:MAG TPA: ATP-binding cassette domain-containing protein [Tetragenococcus sp.]|nr:ATP-binding cassette domain-containing protein [Tetragenococcus sp.]